MFRSQFSNFLSKKWQQKIVFFIDVGFMLAKLLSLKTHDEISFCSFIQALSIGDKLFRYGDFFSEKIIVGPQEGQ